VTSYPYVPCFIGLGSNLGDRRARLDAAVEMLSGAPGVRLLALSGLYDNPAWGFVDQPDFLNGVALIETSLGPLQMLTLLKTVELRVGRRQSFRWGPRELDLDLLTYGDQRVDRRGLVVPHRGLAERASVLVPLRDVAPDFRLPDGRSVDEALAGLDASGMRRV
jgi:2-amino-4-hydroxy-6-hydroxymethyldihydropteridine diphosphokinase